MTDPLDPQAIAAALAGVAEVRVVDACASTNAALLGADAPGPMLMLAEHQTHGRGRRGRRWHSAPGTGLLMSLRRVSRRPLRDLPGLSLAAGVASVRALRMLGLDRVSLKWPNDLLVDGAKLGGILVETRMQGDAVAVVAGIGINWHDAPDAPSLRRKAVCVSRLSGPAPARTAGAIAIARELLAALAAFDDHGLDAFRGEWEAAHAHAGYRMRVRLGDGRVVSGTAEGLGADGSLRLRTRGGFREVLSGTIVSAQAA